MPFKVRIILLCATLALSLSAYAGAASFDATYLLASLGLAGISVGARHVIIRDRQRERWEYRVDTALWGPEDANGKRNVEAGVVALIARNGSELEEMRHEMKRLAEAATRAADAAMLAATSAAEKETPTERRRAYD